ncbi:MAG: hypothetical protein ACI9UQ_000341 [Candidatus Krumholzibacteriia bacterium]|jgi:hypothetical protein
MIKAADLVKEKRRVEAALFRNPNISNFANL